MAHNREVQRDGDRNSEHFQKAREAVDKALDIDPNESLAYTALCNRQLFSEWNYPASDEACRRAVELDPTSSFALSEYAVVLTSNGQFGEAFDQLKKAMETEPTSFRSQAFYANALYLARRYQEAEAHYKDLVELKPDRPATYSWLVRVCEAQGKEAEAFEWTVRLLVAADKGAEAIQRYKAAYRNSGYRGALLERINIGTLPIHAYVQLGDKDKAFEALEQRYGRHDYNLIVYGRVDPLLDPLRSDPRWTDLVRRVEAGGN
jgi:tetratricopeptide (TPR) repeat protein